VNSRNASLTRSGLQPLTETVTELTSPTVYCTALLVVVAASDVPDYGFAALGWGALAGLFVGVLPLAFLKLGARRGRWDTHHVSDRDRRLVPFLFTIASVAVGLTLLAIGSAPRNLIALIIGMFAGLAVMLAVSRVWKISVHAGTNAGGAVVLAAVFGPIGAGIGIVLAAAAGWSRVALGDHSRTQVLAGLAVGAAVAAAVFLPLR
jgi:membrane-associated phospholipid phosphatase